MTTRFFALKSISIFLLYSTVHRKSSLSINSLLILWVGINMPLTIVSHNSILIILILDFHISNLSTLNNAGVFRRVLLLKEVLEVILLSRLLIFKQELDCDVTYWTCNSILNRVGVNYGGFKNFGLKQNHL